MIREVPLAFVLFFTSLAANAQPLPEHAGQPQLRETKDVQNIDTSMQDAFTAMGQMLTETFAAQNIQEDMGKVGQSMSEGVSSPQTQEGMNKVGKAFVEKMSSPETRDKLNKFAETFAAAMKDSMAIIYIADQKNDALPAMTETDISAVAETLPERMRGNIKQEKEFQNTFDISAKDRGVDLRLTRHIGMNMTLAKAFKDAAAGKDTANMKFQTLSGKSIGIDKFQKEKIGEFSAVFAPTPDGKVFYMTNAGAFIAVRIEAADAEKAREVLNQLSPQALMKAFKTDTSSVTVKEAMQEADQAKQDPGFMTKMQTHMQSRGGSF